MLVSMATDIDTTLPPLARVGYRLGVRGHENDTLYWTGRGPHEAYPDRKESARLGSYQQSVLDLYQPHCRPQEYGNLADISSLSIHGGADLSIEGDGSLNVSVWHFSDPVVEKAEYLNQLIPAGYLTVHIDQALMGLGGDDSWSPRVHPQFLLTARHYEYSFWINVRNRIHRK
jgi:beta-galactosidase